jgi:hypothetical protein
MKFTTLLSNASILIFLLFSSSSFAQSQLSDGLPGRFDPNKRNTPRPAGTQPIYRTIDGTNNNIAKTKQNGVQLILHWPEKFRLNMVL